MLLCIHSKAVIPATPVIPAQAGIHLLLDSHFRGNDAKTGFRVKPGMTIKRKGLLTHYTRWPEGSDDP